MNLPLGFTYAAARVGLRKDERDDLGLIVSEQPAAAAAVFTRNRVQAAPVRLARQHLRASGGLVRAVLVNAGNANCATRTGDSVALETCRAAARALACPVEQILPASTGVIGVEMDGGRIESALPALARSLAPENFDSVARAILTTDTRMKVAADEVRLHGGVVRFAGMTKGAGMIHPNMATTLGFVMTDAVLSPEHLGEMLAPAIARSFHCISVDGDTSTNDTVAVLANGASGVQSGEKERKVLAEVLSWVLEDLAEQIARDGEGARKLITVCVSGARDEDSAARIARAIANSPLVKTAVAGSDPNWGRILGAAGYSGVEFDPAAVDIFVQRVLVCSGGVAAEFDEAALKRALDGDDCRIHVKFRGSGQAGARFWTCDLTEDYIKINASYRT